MRTPTSVPGSSDSGLSDRAGGLAPMVRAFVERLRHVPLGVWADLAERATPAADDGPADLLPTREVGARAQLRRLVDETPGHAALVRRRVLELTAAAEGFVHPATVVQMKKVALTAALALSVRSALAADDFEALYAPFAAVLPLHELEAELGRHSAAHDGVLA